MGSSAPARTLRGDKGDCLVMIWQPYCEPLRVTLVRNGMIAVIVGALLARPWAPGGLERWPVATLLALWPSLGGHFVELAFLNGLRPRLPAA